MDTYTQELLARALRIIAVTDAHLAYWAAWDKAETDRDATADSRD